MRNDRSAGMTMLASGALVLAATANAQVAAAPPPADPPSAEAPPSPVRQEQRPNVLVWMLDDVGFAQLACFGGLIATPNIDRVARAGLRYSNYHTAPVCSAARASFLTGRMPHSVNIGGHVAIARPFPGYDGHVPASAGTVAENLRQAGYATFALGKWDHVLDREVSPAGPFRQWPTGQGFEKYYGFLSADTDNWNPLLVSGNDPVATPDEPGYHLNRDLADRAIAMIDARRATDPPRPFFLYWATGTAHAPHHAPADWIARYKGKFDMGWDKAREAILKQQIALGLVPKGTRLAPRPEGMQPWDRLTPDQKKLYARQMEVFAAALSYADEQFGRILDALEASGELDNTIVIITSDNGASAEGAWNGMYSEGLLARPRPATLEENMPFYDAWGGPDTFPNYSYGWAVAGDTPFRYFKHTTFEGGTHVPFVISWPDGISARGEVRGQFAHVSDIAPTILEAAHVPLAERVNNVAQQPMEGMSFAYSFADAGAETRKGPQYVEMFGNKGLWADGWSIVTSHRLEPWDMMTSRPIVEPWELYDLRKDPGQIHDLAKRQPQRLAAMERLFEQQAERYHVNPIGNISEGMIEVFRDGREEFARRGGKWRFDGPVSDLRGALAPPVAALGFTMTAELELPEGSAGGPVFAAGSRHGGMAFYVEQGRPVFVLDTLAGETTQVAAKSPLSQGKTTLTLTVSAPDAAGGRAVTIAEQGTVVAQGRITPERIQGFMPHGMFDIGIDRGSAVLPGARAGVPFSGTIGKVEFDFTAPSRGAGP